MQSEGPEWTKRAAILVAALSLNSCMGMEAQREVTGVNNDQIQAICLTTTQRGDDALTNGLMRRLREKMATMVSLTDGDCGWYVNQTNIEQAVPNQSRTLRLRVRVDWRRSDPAFAQVDSRVWVLACSADNTERCAETFGAELGRAAPFAGTR